MSLQDDIWDCQDALEGTDQEEAFERVYKALAVFETRAEKAEKALERLRNGAYALRQLFEGIL